MVIRLERASSTFSSVPKLRNWRPFGGETPFDERAQFFRGVYRRCDDESEAKHFQEFIMNISLRLLCLPYTNSGPCLSPIRINEP